MTMSFPAFFWQGHTYEYINFERRENSSKYFLSTKGKQVYESHSLLRKMFKQLKRLEPLVAQLQDWKKRGLASSLTVLTDELTEYAALFV